MIREARVGDEEAILAFLQPYATTSMFLRSNLLAHGLGDVTSPAASTYLIYQENDQIRGVFGRSNNGYLMCQCPSAPKEVWNAFAKWLKGKLVAGITGEVGQIALAVKALGFSQPSIGLDRIEPLYVLDLSELAFVRATARAPVPTDAPLLSDWFRAYLIETGIEQDTPALDQIVHERVEIAIQDRKLRILIENETCVSMSGINARADETVQIGGVFTPDHLRGQGRAGLGLAAYLQELRNEGISQAVLFAASAEAGKAYEKIGFQHVGFYQMVLLKERQIYGGPA